MSPRRWILVRGGGNSSRRWIPVLYPELPTKLHVLGLMNNVLGLVRVLVSFRGIPPPALPSHISVVTVHHTIAIFACRKLPLLQLPHSKIKRGTKPA